MLVMLTTNHQGFNQSHNNNTSKPAHMLRSTHRAYPPVPCTGDRTPLALCPMQMK